MASSKNIYFIILFIIIVADRTRGAPIETSEKFQSNMIHLAPEEMIVLSVKPVKHNIVLCFPQNNSSPCHVLKAKNVGRWIDLKINITNNTAEIFDFNDLIGNVPINEKLTKIVIRSPQAWWQIEKGTVIYQDNPVVTQPNYDTNPSSTERIAPLTSTTIIIITLSVMFYFIYILALIFFTVIKVIM